MHTALVVIALMTAAKAHTIYKAVEDLAVEFAKLTEKVSNNNGRMTDYDIMKYKQIRNTVVDLKDKGQVMPGDTILPWYGVLEKQYYACKELDGSKYVEYRIFPAMPKPNKVKPLNTNPNPDTKLVYDKPKGGEGLDPVEVLAIAVNAHEIYRAVEILVVDFENLSKKVLKNNEKLTENDKVKYNEIRSSVVYLKEKGYIIPSGIIEHWYEGLDQEHYACKEAGGMKYDEYRILPAMSKPEKDKPSNINPNLKGKQVYDIPKGGKGLDPVEILALKYKKSKEHVTRKEYSLV